MSTPEVIPALVQAFLHVGYEDCSNAAMHCAPVRFSPITFRLLEAILSYVGSDWDAVVKTLRTFDGWDLYLRVREDHGRYAEDSGR